MTRLTIEDLSHINHDWEAYDHRLVNQLGLDFMGLGALANGRAVQEVQRGLVGRRLAAVSMSSGEGVLGSFAESVATIGTHLGLEARVMTATDEAGLDQAKKWGADFISYAHDDHFVVRRVADGREADNNPCTSRAYVAALSQMAGGFLVGRGVVVLGLGIIGRGAATRLLELGATVFLYDPDFSRTEDVLRETMDNGYGNGQGEGQAIGLKDENALAEILTRTNLIFEATPVARALNPELWPRSPVVVAPGVPLSWPLSWREPGGRGRLWFDPLESGMAAMLAELA